MLAKRRLLLLVSMVGLLLPLILACAAPEPTPTPAPTAAPTKAPEPTKAPAAAPTKAPEPTKAPAAKPTPKPEPTPVKKEPTPKPEAAKPTPGGKLRLIGYDPVGWDPHATTSYRTHRGLNFVLSKLGKFPHGPKYDPWAYTPTPDLAEKWEMPDDTTYIFHLRKGVKWHNKPPVNGRELVAEDIKWTYERLLAKSVGNRFMFEKTKTIETPDNYTVKFTLSEPYAPFLTFVCDPYAEILAKEAGEKTEDGWGDFKKTETVIGTGPFMLKSYQANVKSVFVKNPTYYREGLPYVDEIHWIIQADLSTQIAMLRARQLDVLDDIDLVFLDSIKQTNPDMNIYKYFRTGYRIGYRADQSPFTDLRVRRALSMLLDRDSWIKSLLYGEGVKIIHMPPELKEWEIPKEQLGEHAKTFEYNPELAKKLLAEAGYPEGFKTTLTWTAAYGTRYVDYAELYKDMASKVGIDIDIVLKPYAQFLSSAYIGKYDGMMMSAAKYYDDPDEWFYKRYYPGEKINQLHYDDPELNKLMIEQRKLVDKEKRKEVLWDIQKLLAEQVGQISLPAPIYFSASQPWVQNYRLHYSYDWGRRYEEVWVSKQ